MAYVVDVDSAWRHCGRPAEVEDCARDLHDCGVENCHAVYCTRCGMELAPFDCVSVMGTECAEVTA